MSRDITLADERPVIVKLPLPERESPLVTWLTRNVDAATSWIGQPFARRWPVRIPLLSLLILTALFRWTRFDTAVSGLFFDAQTEQWSWFFNAGCILFYRGGIYPAVALFIAGIALVIAGRVRHSRHEHRAGLFLVALFIIGPGLVVNQGLKNHWGRPRPNQLRQFGGVYEFVPVGSPGPLVKPNSSFPSGHAAVAFYLMSPGFLASPRRRGLSTRLIMGGVVFGGLMALVRVIQGGHFVSDVVWSGAIVYFTAVALAWVILRPKDSLVLARSAQAGTLVSNSASAAGTSHSVTRNSNRTAA
ncbi:MAG TPA: phosphatase PAP2 family protein [Planctomycetaceae bacterium]|nr:phosphatase PAP2 family protein [Planctomycetaceae bacterium]